MPLIKPPMAHGTRERMSAKLETIDDIQAKFGDIKARLGKARGLCRPNGELPKLTKKSSGSSEVGEGKEGGNRERLDEEEGVEIEKWGEGEEGNIDVPVDKKRSRFDVVADKNNIATENRNGREDVPRKSKLDTELEFDDTSYDRKTGGKDDEMNLTINVEVDAKPAKDSASTTKTAGSRQKRSSLAIKNIIKNANDRVKQAQAYSGSSKSHLMPKKGKNTAQNKTPKTAASTTSKKLETANTTEAVAAEKLTTTTTTAKSTKTERNEAKEGEATVNDANEFHPEFEHYEGAAFDDDNDLGFESKPNDSPAKSSALKLFNLDEFDSSSEDEDMHGGRIGIAPSTGSQRSEKELEMNMNMKMKMKTKVKEENPAQLIVNSNNQDKSKNHDDSDDYKNDNDDDNALVDINPFFPDRKIVISPTQLSPKHGNKSPSPPTYPQSSSETRKRLLQKALENDPQTSEEKAEEGEIYQAEVNKMVNELNELEIGNPVGGISDEIIAMLGAKDNNNDNNLKPESNSDAALNATPDSSRIENVIPPLPSPRIHGNVIRKAEKRKAPTKKQRNGLGGSRGFKVPARK